MVTVLQHPLIQRDITVLRDKQTSTQDFRSAMRRIARVLACEAAQHVEMRAITVETPLEPTGGFVVSHDVVLLPVLRAGNGLVEPFTDVIPEAKVGYIGLRRNEHTLQTEEYYYNVPQLTFTSLVIILDPMLATGGSICSTLDKLYHSTPVRRCVVVSVIAAPEGIEKLTATFPQTPIITAALDRCLNDRGFILPGLGDAGDRYHGTL